MMGLPKSARIRMETSRAAPATPGLARGKVTVLNSLNPVAPRFLPAYSRLGAIDCRTPSMTRAATGKKAMVSESQRPCQPNMFTLRPRR